MEVQKKTVTGSQRAVDAICDSCQCLSLVRKSSVVEGVLCRRCYRLEYFKSYTKEYRKLNKLKVREIEKRSEKKGYLGRLAAHRARKRMLRMQTPKCLLPAIYKELKKVYLNRPEGHHVDHIIPIKGKDVCGLHVPWNLQYLQAVENMKKGNRV